MAESGPSEVGRTVGLLPKVPVHHTNKPSSYQSAFKTISYRSHQQSYEQDQHHQALPGHTHTFANAGPNKYRQSNGVASLPQITNSNSTGGHGAHPHHQGLSHLGNYHLTGLSQNAWSVRHHRQTKVKMLFTLTSHSNKRPSKLKSFLGFCQIYACHNWIGSTKSTHSMNVNPFPSSQNL